MQEILEGDCGFQVQEGVRWWTALDPLMADQSVTVIMSVIDCLLISGDIHGSTHHCRGLRGHTISRLVWRQRMRCSCPRLRKSKIPEDEEGDPGA